MKMSPDLDPKYKKKNILTRSCTIVWRSLRMKSIKPLFSGVVTEAKMDLPYFA